MDRGLVSETSEISFAVTSSAGLSEGEVKTNAISKGESGEVWGEGFFKGRR